MVRPTLGATGATGPVGEGAQRQGRARSRETTVDSRAAGVNHARPASTPPCPAEQAFLLPGNTARPRRRVCPRAPSRLPRRPGTTPPALTSDVFHLALGDRIEVDLHERPQEVGVGHHALGGLPAELLVPLHDEDALAHRLHLLRGLGEGPAGDGAQVARGVVARIPPEREFWKVWPNPESCLGGGSVGNHGELRPHTDLGSGVSFSEARCRGLICQVPDSAGKLSGQQRPPCH